MLPLPILDKTPSVRLRDASEQAGEGRANDRRLHPVGYICDRIYRVLTVRRESVKVLHMITCTLKAVLKKKRLTRYALSKKTGISYPALHALFRDETLSYDRRVLDLLCLTLKCKVGDLLQSKPPYRFPRLK